MYKLEKRQSLFIRFFHWTLMLLVMIIVPTGFYVHQPFTFINLNFNRMFAVHVFSGFALSYLLMARAYYSWITKDYQKLVFTWPDFKELPSLFKYYLFIKGEKPPERKYNCGQRLVYTSWFIIISLANISGAFAYKSSYSLPIARAVGGIHHLSWMTLAASLVLAYTVPLHVYLSFTENMSNFQAMFTGYSYTLKPGGQRPEVGEQGKTRVKLPGQWIWNKLKTLFN